MERLKGHEFPVEKDDLLIVEETEAVGEEAFDRSLAGKLWTENPFNTRAFKQTMVDAWRLKKPVEVQELGKNLFLFIFSTKRDLDNVLNSGPWNFDRHVLVLKRISGSEQPSEMALDSTSLWARVYDLPLRLRTEIMATRLGNLMGSFEEVDTRESNRLGKFLRIKVALDLKKPVKRGTVVRFQGKDLKVYFRYERLPAFCFICGKLGHQMRECDESDDPNEEGFDDLEEKDLPFGPWLRASPLPKPNYESRRESQHSSCSKSLFVSSSGSKVVDSGKSREDTEVAQPPSAKEAEEPTLAQLVTKTKLGTREVEEVAETLGFIELTPKATLEKKGAKDSNPSKSIDPASKSTAKRKGWVRQKGRKTTAKAKGVPHLVEMGKRQLFEVNLADGPGEDQLEGLSKKQATGMEIDNENKGPEGVLEDQHLLKQ